MASRWKNPQTWGLLENVCLACSVGNGAVRIGRYFATGFAAAAGTLALSLTATVSTSIQLATSTLLVMGGTYNGTALNPAIAQELGGDPWYPAPNLDPFRSVGSFGHGYLDTRNNPSSPYFGWNFIPVDWPADVLPRFLGKTPYEPSQQQGLHNIVTALGAALPALGPGEKAVAFGYSSSANVMVREMRDLQSQAGGAPSADQLQFFLMGDPNRPNGGILQRFAGAYIPVFDIPFDGSTPLDTPYTTTDLSWQYDFFSDFPTYPLNLLALLNALLTGSIVHGNYFPATLDGPRASPDTTVGAITYITLKTPHLPLLMPLYDIGFPKPLLDLVEPALTVMVDWGYDRSIGPGTPTLARLFPRIDPMTATRDLITAIGEGVHNFSADLTPASAPDPRPLIGRRTARAGEAESYRAKSRQLRHSGSTERPHRISS